MSSENYYERMLKRKVGVTTKSSDNGQPSSQMGDRVYLSAAPLRHEGSQTVNVPDLWTEASLGRRETIHQATMT